MHAHLGRGCAYLQAGRPDAAIEAFGASLALYPAHAASEIGLARAYEALGRPSESRAALDRAGAILTRLDRSKPFEAALVRAQWLAAQGRADAARDALVRLLDEAPPGFAGWAIPVEPNLTQVVDSEALTKIVGRLSERAM